MLVKTARPLKLFILIATMLMACLSVTAQTQARVPPYTITALKAMLFYDNKGTFSPDVASPEGEPFVVPSILWNTTIEGASREGASTSTLVTVEVSGEYLSETTRKIELVARYRKIDARREVVVRQLAPIYIRESGKYVVGFWLTETGCNPVRLTARILGQRQTTTQRIIRFGCGE